MKIESITFIKADALPKNVRQTDNALIAKQIAEELKRLPQGQALTFTSKDASPNTRYTLQKRLQRAGHKVTVRSVGDEKKGYTFYVVRGS